MVRDLDRHWRRQGVPRVLRSSVADDVTADLVAAQRSGRSVEVALGMDVLQFAEQVARANGWSVPWPLYGRMLASAAVGAAAAIVVGFALVLPSTVLALDGVGYVLRALGVEFGPAGPGAWYAPLVYAVYVLFGVAFVVAVLGAVRRGLRYGRRVRETLRAGTVLLPLSAALSVPAAVAVAHLNHFSGAPLVVASEFGLVLGAAAAALVAARSWALRQPAEG
ncbi:hypothetical protein GTR02_01600 [Kineococcus sp. R8]|uniref:hypothetical protein n=1 Tax=Kineococcus siccus TaxID=2696567 RepID=UPI00141223E2|nr:hypothetical protein [Kineococcus siccus]NAZ80512.1 hypothetical protein [Kineococcus siccus]